DLRKKQNYTPEKFYIINKHMEILEYEYNHYKEELFKQISKIKEILNGKIISPEYGLEWPWNKYSKKEATRLQDLSLLQGVGNSVKEQLNELGILTLKDLLNIQINTKIKGISEERIESLKLNAEAIIENKFIIIKKPEFKRYDVEIFFDFEGILDLDEEELSAQYLIGCLVRKNNHEEFIPFLAKKIEDEEKMFKEFAEYLRKEKDFVLYHYANYESVQIKKLGKKYGIDVDFISERMVDLLKILKQSVMCPTSGNSIKTIAPLLGFNWRQLGIKGDDSIYLYLEYLKTNDEKILDSIVRYNEDDVIATRVVKDWLEKLTNNP
ncbi:MAG: TM0106 family RecB-like putative nuclease, partial [Nanoarchaeota archaeon]